MAVSTSTFVITLTNNGSGLFTPTVIRNPSTAASGGTSVTIPWVENTNGGANTTTLLPGVAVQAGLRAVLDNIADGN